MISERPVVAVLMPTSDELGSTINRSLYNVALRMRERPNTQWSLYVGVNGTGMLEDVAKVQTLVGSQRPTFGNIPVEVFHY